MSLKVNDIKQARDDIKTLIDNMVIDFKDFEDALKSKGHKTDHLFGEIYRHAYELIDYLTDDKIEALFK